MILRLSSTIKSYLFLVVYRPPSFSKSLFMSEFSSLLENIISSSSDLCITGDFNFHVDSPDYYSSSFSSLLDTFDLHQHISSPTHSSGHTLDLLITRNSTPMPIFDIIDPSLSDHSAIVSQLLLHIPRSSSRLIKTFRKYSSIDIANFSHDISISSLFSNPASTVSDYCHQFHPRN
jgi:hypothetical protein